MRCWEYLLTISRRKALAWSRAYLGLALTWLAPSAAQPTPAAKTSPVVWMAAFEPPWRALKSWPPNDYMQLFNAGAPWSRAARGVNVFEISKLFIQKGSDQDLTRVISTLAQHGIALAMQGTPLIASDACGRAVEGYGAPNDMAEQAARIKHLGGTVAYIALDEPLYFGHAFKGREAMSYESHPPTPCLASIQELAHETASKLALVRKIFPDVKVGDVEPVGMFPNSGPEFRSMLSQWFQAYETETSRKFDFFDIDCAWLRQDWQPQFEDAVSAVQQARIPLGVIFGGTRADASDQEWLQSARDHIHLIEIKLGHRPARAIFQTWTDHPRRMLPETDPGSFTNLIKTYVESH